MKKLEIKTFKDTYQDEKGEEKSFDVTTLDLVEAVLNSTSNIRSADVIAIMNLKDIVEDFKKSTVDETFIQFTDKDFESLTFYVQNCVWRMASKPVAEFIKQFSTIGKTEDKLEETLKKAPIKQLKINKKEALKK